MENLIKASLCAALAGLCVCSCTNGEADVSPEQSHLRARGPRHFAIEGRSNSTITFHGVRYPNPARADGYSAPRDMVMTVQPAGLQPMPVYASYVPRGWVTFDFGQSEEGEAPHAQLVDDPSICNFSQGAPAATNLADVAGNNIGNVSFRLGDRSELLFFEYRCDELSLQVTDCVETDVSESERDLTVVNPEKPVYERWIHTRHVVYTGIVRLGVFRFTNPNETPHGEPREMIMNGCPFTWEADEIIVDYANNQEDNPSDPIIGG